MTVSREQFLNFSMFMNFKLSDRTNRELIRLRLYTVKSVYAESFRLSESAKEEINIVFSQYGQKSI